ncbi:uncharacterized protein Z518_07172 [Rhinocladiella mackenziei CBS 650.93]|uniref:Uncharacterized protein n=1 Tax=Rhinocladiella mackenziei CBS 650.93 TaxID=1442369 RepID=A0A0D2ICN8_9EURO|nr:uncharacterized protein Z518_07172 [Rhinocladiella mackenziei CBS 650.93]KIX03619.1 hypothetical protein Z518_07172 [Rhinocladiella mackenziei CBS 650.93]
MPPTPYSGYQPAPSPMVYGHGNPNTQFAMFDDPSSKKVNEDSLPPMPSWDTATQRRVEDTSEPPHQMANGDLEMGRLDTQPQRMRGGYNSVPHGPMSPVSPNPPNDYFANNDMSHSYDSDLGAQRMSPNNQGYDNFQAVPLSPPPTYRSNSNIQPVASDKFVAGTASPSPEEYNHQQHQSFQHQQPSSYAPSSISTRYEQSDYEPNRISMPTPYNPQPQPQLQYQARPPSFLQVGRKPVSGSFREV